VRNFLFRMVPENPLSRSFEAKEEELLVVDLV